MFDSRKCMYVKLHAELSKMIRVRVDLTEVIDREEQVKYSFPLISYEEQLSRVKE